MSTYGGQLVIRCTRETSYNFLFFYFKVVLGIPYVPQWEALTQLTAAYSINHIYI